MKGSKNAEGTKTLITIARKMMTINICILKENKPFEQVSHEKMTIRKPKKSKYTIGDVLNFFNQSGFDTSNLEKQIYSTITPD